MKRIWDKSGGKGLEKEGRAWLQELGKVTCTARAHEVRWSQQARHPFALTPLTVQHPVANVYQLLCRMFYRSFD